jgi:sulfonate transport system ATP-binding protein
MNVAILDRDSVAETRLSAQGAAIALSEVTRAFGAHQVLRGIDLHIPAGQFVAIVGRSGCGKSTFLRLIAGLSESTSGAIIIEGETKTRRETVRLMFQEPRLLPWQRVAANVEVGLTHADDKARRRREAADLLFRVGLAGRENDWPSVLSGGQKQRVALARALASHPRVLLLDEPLGALDALTRIEMQDLIESVWRDKGFTAVVVTHDVTEAVALADRILLMEDGKIGLDVMVNLPRPRRRADPLAANIEERILDRLLGRRGPAS